MIPLPRRHPRATRLYLVRHAAAALEPGRCCGSLDVPLSDTGLEQARLLGQALADVEIVAVYTSPLARACQTAAEIARHHDGRAPRQLPGLAEIDFGELEGKRFDEIAATHPDTYSTWMTRPVEVEFPGGERFADFARRVRETARDIRLAHPGEAAALVGHGGPLGLVIADALAMPADALFRLDHSHAAVSVVDWHDDTPAVRLLNARLAGTIEHRAAPTIAHSRGFLGTPPTLRGAPLAFGRCGGCRPPTAVVREALARRPAPER